jgi:hypothetical protein
MPFTNRKSAVKKMQKTSFEAIKGNKETFEREATKIFQARAYYSNAFSRPPYKTGFTASNSRARIIELFDNLVVRFEITNVPYVQKIIKGLDEHAAYGRRNVPKEAARLFSEYLNSKFK